MAEILNFSTFENTSYRSLRYIKFNKKQNYRKGGGDIIWLIFEKIAKKIKIEKKTNPFIFMLIVNILLHKIIGVGSYNTIE